MRLRSLALVPFLLAASFGAAACGGAPTVEPAPPAPPPVASAAEPAPTDGAEPEAPAEPPAKSFAELRAAAMACPTIEDGSFEDGCAAREAWTDEQPAFEDGKANAQLLEMLVDADPRARLLAAERLRMSVHEENLDAALADRLIAAAAAERNEAVIPAMSAMLTGQNLVKVAKTARVVEVAKAHPSAEFRESTLLHIGFFNRDESILGWAEEASRDKGARMRNAALRAAAYQASNYADSERLRPRACKLIDSMRTDKDSFVRNGARTLLAESRCEAFYGKLLDDLSGVELKKDTSKGFGVDPSYGTALRAICGRDGLDPKLRGRAAKAALRIAEATQVLANTRFYALEALARCDASAGKALAQKLANDANSTVANLARELAK